MEVKHVIKGARKGRTKRRSGEPRPGLCGGRGVKHYPRAFPFAAFHLRRRFTAPLWAWPRQLLTPAAVSLCPVVRDRQRQQPVGGKPDSRPEPGFLQPPRLLDLRVHQHHQRPEDERAARGRGPEGRRQQAEGHRRQRGERVSSAVRSLPYPPPPPPWRVAPL